MTLFIADMTSAPGRDQAVRRYPEVFAAALGGMVAACLGFGVLAVLVLFMWITAPSPGSGPDGALRVAAALWLMAHGSVVLRPDALTGGWVPIGVTPLLLMALPCWLVHRAAAHAFAAPEENDRAAGTELDRAIGPFATAGWLVGGYLLVALWLLVFTGPGALRGAPLSALLDVPLVAAAATACGAGSVGGWHAVRPSALVRRGLTRLALPYGGVGAACRAALVGAGVLAGGGTLLAVVATLWHWHAAADAFGALAGSLPGRFALLLLMLALLPNAGVWAASYALGPGFAIGPGGTVGLGGVYGYPPVLPDFPLLAALPGPTGPDVLPSFEWIVLVLPLAAGAALGWQVSGSAAERGWPVGRTASVALLAAVVNGGVVAVAAAFAGGPLGVGTLAVFGPNAADTGLAAACWTAAVGLPVGVVARWWRTRQPRIVPAAGTRAR